MVFLLRFPPNPNYSSLLCNPAFLAGLLIVNVYHLEGFLSSWILYCQVSSDNLFYFSLLPNLFTHHTSEIKELICFSEYTKEKNKQSALLRVEVSPSSLWSLQYCLSHILV